MVTRTEAFEIAEAYLAQPDSRLTGRRVREVIALGESPFSAPVLYGVDASRCWIAYVDRPSKGLFSSEVVLIAKDAGTVVSAGSANDEG